MIPACEELGIGLVAWGPFGKGYLTGTIPSSATFVNNDLRSTMPRFTHEAMKANRPVVKLIERVAQEKGVKNSQVALAWLLARKPWIVPIPGTTQMNHLDEDIDAANIKLSEADSKGGQRLHLILAESAVLAASKKQTNCEHGVGDKDSRGRKTQLAVDKEEGIRLIVWS